MRLKMGFQTRQVPFFRKFQLLKKKFFFENFPLQTLNKKLSKIAPYSITKRVVIFQTSDSCSTHENTPFWSSGHISKFSKFLSFFTPEGGYPLYINTVGIRYKPKKITTSTNNGPLIFILVWDDEVTYSFF